MSKDDGFGWCQNLKAGVHDPFEAQKWQKGAFLLNEVMEIEFRSICRSTVQHPGTGARVRQSRVDVKSCRVWLVPELDGRCA